MDYRSCEPKAGLSQLSAALYGHFFWDQALTRARDLAIGTEKLEQDWAKMFTKHSNAAAPTASESYAQRLRDQADQIEAQEALNRLSSMDQRIIADARRCEREIIEKLRTM